MIFYYGLMYLAVFLAATGQILMKTGSGRGGLHIGVIFFNIHVLIGLCTMLFSMLFSLRGMSVVPLRDMAFILPSVYVLVPFFSRIFLKEHLGHRTIIGTLILIIGVILFNIPIFRLF